VSERAEAAEPPGQGSGRPMPGGESVPGRSATAAQFGAIGRLLARGAFGRIRVEREAVERVRELGTKGTLVYVLHQRSIIDYLMVNVVLLREGLLLPQFASGVSALWFRRVRDIAAVLWQRVQSASLYGREAREARERDRCVELVRRGVPVLIFVRSARARRWRRRAADPAREGTKYLQGIVHSLRERTAPVYLVPIAIFRSAGYPKRETTGSAIFHIVREVPGEARRLLASLWDRRNLVMTVGRELSLPEFIEQHREAGEEQIVNRLTRALHGFLHSEERVVWGPPLRPRSVVRDAVLSGGEIAALVRQLAQERCVAERQIWKEAEDAFEEMAGNFDGLYFGFLAYLFKRLWPRVFSGLEIIGLEKVVACLRQYPIVLVPCHRSHVDYLVLSWIFYENFLSPLHIAAGINLAFWPLGPLFRRAGAFFIRRSFGDNPLYKLVFRNYLTFLIREGYTQEFFIEGGRTRTGKIMTPKLGMLSAIVNAFTQGVRDDLYLVPVSIHYGRVVEEEAYRREIAGEKKERESLRSLLQARSILRQRYGTVYVTFAEPISLTDALGDRKERFLTRGEEEEVAEEKRHFIQKLGFRLVREVNAVAVAGSTSVSATALLAAPRPALRVRDFLNATASLAGMLRFLGVRFTASLERNLVNDFQESMAWLGSHGLVQRLRDGSGEVLYVPPEKRINVDFYKNNIIHFFLLPSVVARALRAGMEMRQLDQEVWWWLDLYRWEFALFEREALGGEVKRVLAYLETAGALQGGVPDREHPLLVTAAGVLENFQEAYRVTARTISLQRDWPLPREVLLSRVRRAFSVAQALGEVTKPEANSAVTYTCAINRFAELGYIFFQTAERAAKGSKRITRGPAYDQLPALADRLES